MRTILAFVIVALMVSPVFADENPNVRLFMSGSSTEAVDYMEVPMGTVDFYLLADCMDTGLRAVALTLTIDVSGMLGVATFPLAGTQQLGGINNVDGWALAWTDCEYGDSVTGILHIATIPYGAYGAGSAVITAHPSQAFKATGCNFISDQYCVYQNLGVGETAPAGDEDCECEGVPVEDSTWGTIKSLYR